MAKKNANLLRTRHDGAVAAQNVMAVSLTQPAANTSVSRRQQVFTLTVLSLGVFAVLSVWYVGSAVAPLMRADSSLRPNGLSNADASLLTGAANVGFVCGCIMSATFNLPDLFTPSRLILAGSLATGGLTALACVGGMSFEAIIGLRALAGSGIALVYPPSVKLISSWFAAAQRSTAIGFMFAWFCLGSAFPLLLKAMGPELITSWRVPLMVTSGVAVGAGLLVAAFVRNGPFPFPAAPKLAPFQVVEVLRTPRVLLPILGYVGHQVEVMTMWVWLAPFLVEVHGVSERRASLLAFLAVTMGGPGSWLGGWLGDRYGRIRVVSLALVASCSCGVLIGVLVEAPLNVTIVLCIAWGLTILADSPSFPAIISSNARQDYVGTALLVQLGLGYLLCAVMLYVTALLGDILGWRWCFPIMAVFPGAALLAMQMLAATSATRVTPMEPRLISVAPSARVAPTPS